jgi:hypothetical protein
MSARIHARQQRGQALVAVIVLIALLFLVGTATTLAVSSSLQTVRQTANEDWRGYAAESAATRDLANASSSPAPTSTGCGGLSGPSGKVNGFPIRARRCATLGIDVGSMVRDGVAAQKVGGGSCATPVVTVGVGRIAWGTIAWLPKPGFDPQVQVYLDTQNACSGGNSNTCTTYPAVSVGIVYFSCKSDDTIQRTLHILVKKAGGAGLGAFYVRSADENDRGGDCVVTSTGLAGGAINEGDLLLPSCTTSGTSVSFMNRLLP